MVKEIHLFIKIFEQIRKEIHFFSKNQKNVKKRVKKRWSLQKSQKSLKKWVKQNEDGVYQYTVSCILNADWLTGSDMFKCVGQ